MPSLLVIRLHPVDPIAGDEFTPYLEDLSIAAHEVSFDDPAGTEPAFGTAAYIPPTNPGSLPPSFDQDTRIVQHFGPDLPILLTLYAVATAVIKIPDPPPGGEYETADVRLEITRGADDIVHEQVYYNVPVITDTDIVILPGAARRPAHRFAVRRHRSDRDLPRAERLGDVRAELPR